MIAALIGRIFRHEDGAVVVDVNGVGYRASCSARTLRRIGNPGDPVQLEIETIVREDAIQLFGFADVAERDWFRLLTTVQGVGSRVALNILGAAGPDQLTNAIAAQDRTVLTAADGVGPKLATRILSELKDKVVGMAFTPAPAAAMGREPAAAGAGTGGGATADAISALVNLGYRRAEAFGAVATAAQRLGPDASVGDLVRAGLKELSQ